MLRSTERTSIFGVMCGLLGGCFLLAGLVHTTGGADFGELAREPRMIELGLLELISGAVLCAAAVAGFARQLWAWRAGILGHVLGIATSILGLLSPRIGFGPLTDVANMFFLMMLILLSLDLLAVWRLRPRNRLRRAQHRMAARLY
jgi:hypothetical protein